jgi:hypothetical protein
VKAATPTAQGPMTMATGADANAAAAAPPNMTACVAYEVRRTRFGRRRPATAPASGAAMTLGTKSTTDAKPAARGPSASKAYTNAPTNSAHSASTSAR